MDDFNLPMSGAHTKIRILVGNNPPFGEDIVVAWSIDEEAEIFHDDHVNQDHAFSDTRHDGWNLHLELHHSSTALLDALEAIRKLRRQRKESEPIGVMLQLNHRGDPNALKAYLFTRIAVKESLGAKGRRDRVTYSLNCFAETRELVR